MPAVPEVLAAIEAAGGELRFAGGTLRLLLPDASAKPRLARLIQARYAELVAFLTGWACARCSTPGAPLPGDLCAGCARLDDLRAIYERAIARGAPAR